MDPRPRTASCFNKNKMGLKYLHEGVKAHKRATDLEVHESSRRHYDEANVDVRFRFLSWYSDTDGWENSTAWWERRAWLECRIAWKAKLGSFGYLPRCLAEERRSEKPLRFVKLFLLKNIPSTQSNMSAKFDIPVRSIDVECTAKLFDSFSNMKS